MSIIKSTYLINSKIHLCIHVDIADFGVIPLHAQPDNAVVENDALVDVYDAMVADWGLEVITSEQNHI